MLDEIQSKVAAHKRGNIVLHAGPGAGKTKVIAERAVRLICDGTDSRRILIITFTNAATNELRWRIQQAIPDASVKISTIHAYCYEMLRDIFPQENIPKLVSEKESERIYHKVCGEIGFLPGNQGLLRIQIQKAQGLSWMHWSADRDYKAYGREMARNNQIDLDDLVFMVRMLLEDDRIRDRFAERWDYIMLDEAHDCTRSEGELIHKLSRNNLLVVLDANQSIHAWRGAECNYWKRLRGVTYTLPFSYRCPQSIFDVASSIVEDPCRLRCLKEQGNLKLFEVDPNQHILSAKPSDMILCRTQREVEGVADVCKKHGMRVSAEPTVFDTREAEIMAAYAKVVTGDPLGWELVLTHPIQERSRTLYSLIQKGTYRGGFENLLQEWKHTSVLEDPHFLTRYEELLSHYPTDTAGFLEILERRKFHKNGVRVMTMHASKGLEAERVILYNAADGMLPLSHEGDLSSERRLTYVSLTRAKSTVELIVPPEQKLCRFLRGKI